MEKETRKSNNYAYIDGANLYNAVKQYSWEFDYGRFRVWLTEKYFVSRAYIFLGLVPKYNKIYTYLQEMGFTLVFKEVSYGQDGKIKGNCDADIVLKIMSDLMNNAFNKAILVSSDGDYAGLVSFLMERNKILTILSPYFSNKCSILLKKTSAHIAYIPEQVRILSSKNEKTPDADKTA